MSANTITAVVSALESSTLTVSFTGRDGDLDYKVGFPVKDIAAILTPDALKALCEAAARTLVYRTSKVGLKPAPHVNTAADLLTECESSDGEGRFKISKEDIAKATKTLKDLEALGKVALWEKKHGMPTTLENITKVTFEERVAKVKADKAAEAARHAAMLADLGDEAE